MAGHIRCHATSDRAKTDPYSIRVQACVGGGDLKNYWSLTLETLPAGPCTNMAHQTTASGFGGDDCKDVQHVVGRRHLSKQSEIHNRSVKIEEDESRSGGSELISTNFELDIPVKNSRKSSCDQIRRAL